MKILYFEISQKDLRFKIQEDLMLSIDKNIKIKDLLKLLYFEVNTNKIKT